MEELVLPMATMVGATDISKISARVGLDVVSAAIGRMTYHGAHYNTVVGGTGLLAEALAQRLGERVVTNANVTRVSQDGSEVRIAYTTDGVENVVRAEQCVLAVPVTEMLRLCEGLPASKVRAFEALEPVTAISLGLIIDGATEAPWDRMYWMHTGGTIKSLLNDEYFSPRKRPPQERRVFSLIISGEQAEEVWDLSDSELADRVVSKLAEIFPEAAEHTRVCRIVRHEPAMMSGPPGVERDLELRAESVGRIHFCGADIVGVGTDHAIRTGEEAARRVASFAAEQGRDGAVA
jgi:monoamine oxidase